MKLLLDLGANKEAKNKDKNTPLHLAGWEGQDKAALVLINRGANIKVE